MINIHTLCIVTGQFTEILFKGIKKTTQKTKTNIQIGMNIGQCKELKYGAEISYQIHNNCVELYVLDVIWCKTLILCNMICNSVSGLAFIFKKINIILLENECYTNLRNISKKKANRFF